MSAAPVRAAIGLGANLGDPAPMLASALDAIGQLAQCRITAVSPLYRTAPVDALGPDFVNAVALVETTLAPAELLAQLQAIELRGGRERPFRNAPRTLDLDLLLYGDARIDTPALRVPHPRMHERAFVLVPLLDVWADATVPGRGAARELLAGVRGQPIARLDG